jgi:hypothetical protein
MVLFFWVWSSIVGFGSIRSVGIASDKLVNAMLFYAVSYCEIRLLMMCSVRIN